MDDLKYEVWFAHIKNVGPSKKRKLRELYPDAKELYDHKGFTGKNIMWLGNKEVAGINEAQKKDPEALCDNLIRKDIRLVTCRMETFPRRLKEISNAPYALFYKGNMVEDNLNSAAIVGSRSCTSYGEREALNYGEALARAGFQVISGMAKGIDGAGQRGALRGGRSFGILGCGVDICYPQQNKGLYEELCRYGGVISEYAPGEPPLPANFPARNRIISAFSDVVLVMEAKGKSGSQITVDFALEQGKDIYALPGPVSCAHSKGCHILIKQGAGILISPEDLISDLLFADYVTVSSDNSNQTVNKESERIKQKTGNPSPEYLTETSEGNSPDIKNFLESTESMVYSFLDFFPKGVGQLASETKLSIPDLLEGLSGLELKGLVRELGAGHYIRKI
ncbi:MAG: DNA-processing protein DprA [Lachnospiraceae bacterium]|nr:DNA-processing protein DprA [Lachnospiraceae bacterium]